MGFDQQTLLQTAREYCRLIESAEAGDDDWLNALSQVLPRLHALIAALDVPDDARDQDAEADLDSRFELFSRLHRALGERDHYWLEFDAATDNHAGSGSLADDLTDIYFDLKRGLRRLATSQDPRQTLNDWRTGFSIHWGQHLVDAERHLYALNSRNRPA